QNLERSLLAIDPVRHDAAIDFLRDAVGVELDLELQRLAAEGPASLRRAAAEALDRAEQDEQGIQAPIVASDGAGPPRPIPPAPPMPPAPPAARPGPAIVGPRRIVLFGMMTKVPVAGVVWQTLHYLLGLRDLGFHVTYVEAHGR